MKIEEFSKVNNCLGKLSEPIVDSIIHLASQGFCANNAKYKKLMCINIASHSFIMCNLMTDFYTKNVGKLYNKLKNK